MSILVWLSFPLGLNDPRPPAIPALELEDLYTISEDGANVQILKVASHTGTHVDAPLHVIEGGLAITDFRPDEFVFKKPVVIDLRLESESIVQPVDLQSFSEDLCRADIALFRFGLGATRVSEPERFSLKSPGFGLEAARWLKTGFPNLRAVGTDAPSLACIAHLADTMSAHHELLGGEGARFLVVEDMDLDKNLSALLEVRVSPWLVQGMDSGPCSIVGVVN